MKPNVSTEFATEVRFISLVRYEFLLARRKKLPKTILYDQNQVSSILDYFCSVGRHNKRHFGRACWR